MVIVHRTLQPFIGVLVIQQAYSPSGNLHQEDCQYFLPVLLKCHTERKPEGRKSLHGKIQLPNVKFSQRRKNISTFSDTWTRMHIHALFFLTLRRICVHTSVRSHHITHGEEILLFVCALFCAFPFPGLSSSVTSPMHTDILQVHTLIHFVTLIPDSQGTPISSLSPSLKS